ncbi:hypothetical protein ACP275_14G010100 [Erythranthe tilingii]
MGPPRKSKSVYRRYTDEVSPCKDGDSAKRSNNRKRKSRNMLGPRWTTEELTHFYDAYRKYGKDWKKVANAVRTRSLEMVDALYKMNKAYLNLPHGTASLDGLIAMMTDQYSNMAGNDSDQENNEGEGSSRKPQKHARGKVQPTTSKASNDQFISHSQTAPSSYGCLSLLKKKRSEGSRPCTVGKRTPRFPVSFSYENINGEKYVSPTRQGLKLKANANDDEVAHQVAIALAEASQRGDSPQVYQTPIRRAESVTLSPFRLAKGKHSLAEMANTKILAADMDEEDLEGSPEAGTGELCRVKSYRTESLSVVTVREKAKTLEAKKFEVDNNRENYLDDIKEECSGTEEGQRFGATRGKLYDAKICRSSRQSQRKKSKKVFLEKDEAHAFDALQTLADLSLMMPMENEIDTKLQFKEEDVDHVDESVSLEAPPRILQKQKHKHSGVKMKRYQPISSLGAASTKTSNTGKASVFNVTSAPEEDQDPHQSIPKTTRKKQKLLLSKIKKTEAHPDIHLSKSPGIEAGDGGNNKKLRAKSKKSSQSSTPNVMKSSENSSSADLQKEASESVQAAIQVPVVNQENLPTKVRSRRKMQLKKPQVLKDLNNPDKISNDHSSPLTAMPHDTSFSLKEKLSSCLSNPCLRRWCTYEWFYSAIDYPWFAKREFDEYLCHVGLGNVPRLTRVEWGVIRSSLGKPRRFSEQFLKEEKEKLSQYRDSVRKHYTELRKGVREGLPTDLARPLSVGQRVIAIHPKTREIHDGSVLTVDHSRCRVQFDRHDLGVEFVKDIDCMPLNPVENMPALLGRQTRSIDKFLENSNELNINGRAHESMKLSPGEMVDDPNGISQLSPSANSASLLKQTKVASANANVHMKIGSAETASYPPTTFSQSSALAQIQAKEADVLALAELTRALDKKEAVIRELRHMNDDVLENQKDDHSSLKDSEPFKKQYAAVLVQLNETNEQVSSALCCLRQRNTYQRNVPLAWSRSGIKFAVPGEEFSFDGFALRTYESGSHANEIIDSSRTKSRQMVDAAIQAMSSLKCREDNTLQKIDEAVDYVNDQLPSDDSSISAAHNPKSTTALELEAQIPSELISRCVATLLMIQKCTERQFPPSDVARILDSAVTSLKPCTSQNLPVYTEIQKCMGIIRNQIMALIPT